MSAHEKAVEAVAQSIGCTRDDTWEWLKQNKPSRVDELQTEAAAAITAYLASMEAQGWVMVPREATDDMVDAARHFLEPQTERIGRACYRAMIDTAMLAAKEGQP